MSLKMASQGLGELSLYPKAVPGMVRDMSWFIMLLHSCMPIHQF
jgi:hypothetical protein